MSAPVPYPRSPAMRSPAVRLVSAGAVGLVLALLALQVGAGPFLDGLRRLDGPTVAEAVALTAVATVAASWRWTVIARALGDAVPLRSAVADYYRSQLLNCVLPGGVVGDVHRAVAPGRSTAARGLRARTVAWDRGTGQVVQAALLVAAFLLIDPGRWPMVAAAAALLGLCLGVVRIRRGRTARGRAGRWLAVAASDARTLLRPATVLGIVAASLLVVLSHATVFLLAALATGTEADPLLLLPVALGVQAAMVVPTGLGGWGVREGAAAAAFAASGLGAEHGVAAAVAAGVLALVAVLPGTLSLVLGRRRAARARRTTSLLADGGLR